MCKNFFLGLVYGLWQIDRRLDKSNQVSQFTRLIAVLAIAKNIFLLNTNEQHF